MFENLRSTKRGVPLECLTFQQNYVRPWYMLWEMGDKIHLSCRFMSHGFELREIWSHGEVEQRTESFTTYDSKHTDCEKATVWGFPDRL